MLNYTKDVFLQKKDKKEICVYDNNDRLRCREYEERGKSAAPPGRGGAGHPAGRRHPLCG